MYTLGDLEAFLEGVGEQLDDWRRVVVFQRVEDLNRVRARVRVTVKGEGEGEG